MFETPVFVSFDYENDQNYQQLLQAWHANPRFRFVFQDESSAPLDATEISRLKAELTAKIQQSKHTLVIVGPHANEPHPQQDLIGYRNWINFQIAISRIAGNRLVAVKIDRDYELPEELLGAKATWAMSFTEAQILQALEIV